MTTHHAAANRAVSERPRETGRTATALAAVAIWAMGPLENAQAAGAGYWHTRGDWILDANNQEVQLTGINWL